MCPLTFFNGEGLPAIFVFKKKIKIGVGGKWKKIQSIERIVCVSRVKYLSSTEVSYHDRIKQGKKSRDGKLNEIISISQFKTHLCLYT